MRPWYKLWRSAWSDQQILALDPCERWLFLTCLKLAGEGAREGEIAMPDFAIAAAAALPPSRCADHRTAEQLARRGIAALVRGRLVTRRDAGGLTVRNFVHYQQQAGWGGARLGAGRPVKSESSAIQDESKTIARSREVREVREDRQLQDLQAVDRPGTSPTARQKPPTRRQIAEAVWQLHHPDGEAPRHDRQLFAFWRTKEREAAARRPAPTEPARANA